jgi:hypothetical protein
MPRTTVTLDPDVDAKLKQLARERGVSFKIALNDAIRLGIGRAAGEEEPYDVPARALGVRPGVNLDKSLRLASELEDSELVRKLELRK